MPSMVGYAQVVEYPNGGLSGAFIVTMSRSDMCRFADRIINDEWPDKKTVSPDDFRSGSSRMDCAHDGRWWATIRAWSMRVSYWDVQIGDVLVREGATLVPGDSPERMLSMGEIALLFYRGGEFGWHHLKALGIADSRKALARTVLEWSKSIIEWSPNSPA